MPNAVTTRLVNLSVISEQKVEQTDLIGRTIMTTINQKNPSPNAPKLNTMMMDGNELKNEIESDYEELEFDDASAVDYDLDYTHSV